MEFQKLQLPLTGGGLKPVKYTLVGARWSFQPANKHHLLAETALLLPLSGPETDAMAALASTGSQPTMRIPESGASEYLV